MTFHQAGFDTVESRYGHDEGWRSTFDDLAGYLPEFPGPERKVP